MAKKYHSKRFSNLKSQKSLWKLDDALFVNLDLILLHYSWSFCSNWFSIESFKLFDNAVQFLLFKVLVIASSYPLTAVFHKLLQLWKLHRIQRNKRATSTQRQRLTLWRKNQCAKSGVSTSKHISITRSNLLNEGVELRDQRQSLISLTRQALRIAPIRRNHDAQGFEQQAERASKAPPSGIWPLSKLPFESC